MKCKRCGEDNPAEIHKSTGGENEMTDKEVMQMALDALESLQAWQETPENFNRVQAIDALRTALAQPERAECDGGQCGIGGYCKECPKPLVKLKEMLEVQGRDGTWNYDPYFHGMYNGMEVMLAVLENREPVFRGAPKKWLSKKEWQGLTDEEVKILATQGRTDFSRPAYNEFYSAIEQALKEKNT